MFILPFTLQNFISTLVVVLLALCGRVSVEKLNWRLVRVWLPVNVIFIAMLVSGMYRYKMNFLFYIFLFKSSVDVEPDTLFERMYIKILMQLNSVANKQYNSLSQYNSCCSYLYT